MDVTFTYINFRSLVDKELDDDFKKQCHQHGAKDDTKVYVNPVHSLTGHDTYIVVLENVEN